jgi:hypothetical protein
VSDCYIVPIAPQSFACLLGFKFLIVPVHGWMHTMASNWGHRLGSHIYDLSAINFFIMYQHHILDFFCLF